MNKVPISYYQEVLDKISHADPRVFRKELRKAFKRLLPEEREELKNWFRNACLCKIPQHILTTARVHEGSAAQPS